MPLVVVLYHIPELEFGSRDNFGISNQSLNSTGARDDAPTTLTCQPRRRTTNPETRLIGGFFFGQITALNTRRGGGDYSEWIIVGEKGGLDCISHGTNCPCHSYLAACDKYALVVYYPVLASGLEASFSGRPLWMPVCIVCSSHLSRRAKRAGVVGSGLVSYTVSPMWRPPCLRLTIQNDWA